MTAAHSHSSRCLLLSSRQWPAAQLAQRLPLARMRSKRTRRKQLCSPLGSGIADIPVPGDDQAALIYTVMKTDPSDLEVCLRDQRDGRFCNLSSNGSLTPTFRGAA